MDDDLIAAIRGAAPTPATTVDPVLATIYAESSQDPDERKAVAAVIANRAKANKLTPQQVVNQPGQFEAVSSPAGRARMASLTADSPEYKALVGQVGSVLAGKEDPTGGATSYYAPEAQTALGRAKPSFDDGTGVQVGKQLFFGGKMPPLDPDLVGAIRGQPEAGSLPIAAPSPGMASTALPGQTTTTTKAQDAAFAKLGQAKALDQNAEKGSAANPFAQMQPGVLPETPGAYYIDLGGTLQRTPGGDVDANDIKKAVDSGDYMQASRLVKQQESQTGSAFGNRFLSGAMLGGKNEAGAIISHPMDFLHGGFDNPEIQQHIAASDYQDAIQHAQHPFASDMGSVTGALASGGAASALTGGGADLPLLARLGFAGAEGAGMGGANGFLAADGGNAQRAAAAKQGAEVGAIAGPAGEIANAGGGYLANKVLGMRVSPETAALAKAAKDKFGINLRGGQIADTPSTNFFDSVLNRTPLTGYAKSTADQRQAFTSAVAKTFGEKADGLTPEVMQRARTRIGADFDKVGANTTIADAPVLASDLDAVAADAGRELSDAQMKPLQRNIDDIKTAFTQDAQGNDVLSGDAYQNLTQKGSPLSRLLANGDPAIKQFGQKIKESLYSALERNARTEDLATLAQAKQQYARMKTVEPLAEKAGPEGQISPPLLLQALRNNYDNLAYDGGGDLGQLAQIGQRFLKEPPSSGTAERLRAQALLGLGGLATGAGGVWALQNPEEVGKKGVEVGAAGLAALLAGKAGAVALDNPAYRALLLRAATKVPTVVRKGSPLLNAPSVMNSTTFPLLANRVTGQPAN